ncbi:MAG: hypothetical protein ACTSYO_09900, partial [Candidatus Ranarchaeia archaeon]
MRTRQVCLVLALFIVIVAFSTSAHPVQADGTEQLIFNEIRRDATASTFGVTTVDDTYSVFNNGSTVITHTTVYYPKQFLELLTYRKAFDSGEVKLAITPDEKASTEYFKAYVVVFNSPLKPGDNYKFIVRSEYHDLFYLRDPSLYQEGTVQEFQADYYWLPLVNAPIESAISRFITRENTVFFNVPANSTFVSDQQRSYIEYQGHNLAPMTYTPMSAMWIDNTQAMIEYVRFERQLRIDVWGYVTVIETHRIRNLGYFEQQMISLEYDIDMANWSVYGELGEYKEESGSEIGNPATFHHSQQSPTSTHIFLIKLRYSLRHLDTYTFYLKYRIPLSSLQKYESLTAEFSYSIKNDGFWVARQQITRITLPHGAAIISFSHTPTEIVSESGFTTLVYRQFNTTRTQSLDVKVNYIPNYVTALGRPLFFSLIIGVIATIYVGLRRFTYEKAPMVVQQEVIPKDLLMEYSELYD